AGHLAGQDQRVLEMLEVDLNGSLQATFPAVTEDAVNASKLLVRVRRVSHVPVRVFRVSPDSQAAAKVPEMFLAAKPFLTLFFLLLRAVLLVHGLPLGMVSVAVTPHSFAD